jgi:hypothetical protein
MIINGYPLHYLFLYHQVFLLGLILFLFGFYYVSSTIIHWEYLIHGTKFKSIYGKEKNRYNRF